MRRALGTLAGVMLILGVVAPAGAQTYAPNAPVLSLSSTVVTPLTTVTAVASAFPAKTLVTLTGHSTPVVVGTAMTDGSGSASFTFAMPYLEPGAHTMVASAGNVLASADLTILASATPDDDVPKPSAAVPASAAVPPGGAIPRRVGAVATPTPVASGGLAFTGADVAGLALAGLALVAAGGLALLRGRRRRSIV